MKERKIEKWATFDSWLEDGYAVKKGEKSIFRSPTGNPLFSDKQVTELDDWKSDLIGHLGDIY